LGLGGGPKSTERFDEFNNQHLRYVCTHILEETSAFVAGWGIKVGAETVLVIGCGRNEGRGPPRLLDGEICDNTAGGDGETRGGEDLAGPSKRFKAVARGIAEGEGGEVRVQETGGGIGKENGVASSSSIAVS